MKTDLTESPRWTKLLSVKMIKHDFSLQASALSLFTVCVCLPILFSKFTFPGKSLTSGWKCCSVPLWYDVWKLCVYKRPKTFCAGSAPWYQLGDPSTAVEKRQPQGSGLHRMLELLERNSTVSKRGAAHRFPWLTYIELSYLIHLHLTFSSEYFYLDSSLGNTVYLVT